MEFIWVNLNKKLIKDLRISSELALLSWVVLA